MSEQDVTLSETQTSINEAPPSPEVSEEAPVSAPAEAAAPPPKQPRTKRQQDSLAAARSSLATKRKQRADLAMADELQHLNSVNRLLQENIDLRKKLTEMPEPAKPRLIPTPPESPPSIQKPRAEGLDRTMSARDLMRSMGM